MEEKMGNGSTIKRFGFWKWAVASFFFRLTLSYFSENLNFSARPEVTTPLNSLRRLAEGYWLKQLEMSPYSGSMYHGSPLLLPILGPLTVKKIYGQPSQVLCCLVSAVADLLAAFLIRETGHRRVAAHTHHFTSLGILKRIDFLPSGDIAAMVYLWNPFTVVSCIGFNTTPIENLFIILSIYGSSAGLAPLSAFGWVIASHLSLYPLILVIPIILLLGFGLDAPPRKLFVNLHSDESDQAKLLSPYSKCTTNTIFCWRKVTLFFVWAFIWMSYVLTLCSLYMKEHGGLHEMLRRTYGFILTAKDLSPNIGVLWYFFSEVFEFFRDFFLMVFHANILFMVLPLAIRLNHRPCFLAFVYIAISSMLKSYPSVGDAALYLSLLALFVNELAEMQYSFFLFCGYAGVFLLSPVMHNLWIWRGTGNANFYYATSMAYACFQIVLITEALTTMLNYDRKITKLCSVVKNSKPELSQESFGDIKQQ